MFRSSVTGCRAGRSWTSVSPGLSEVAAPVADDQGLLVGREPGLEREVLDGIGSDHGAGLEVDLDHRVAVGCGDEQAGAISGDRQATGDGVGLDLCRLEEDLRAKDQLPAVEAECLDVPLVGTGQEPKAVGVQASPRKPALAPPSLSSDSGRAPVESPRKTLDLLRTAKNAPVGCKARSLGRPVKGIEPPSIRWPVETRNEPSGCRPIQRIACEASPRPRPTTTIRARLPPMIHLARPTRIQAIARPPLNRPAEPSAVRGFAPPIVAEPPAWR